MIPFNKIQLYTDTTYIYKDIIWTTVYEELHCACEVRNVQDLYTVGVMHDKWPSGLGKTLSVFVCFFTFAHLNTLRMPFSKIYFQKPYEIFIRS